jgi:cell division septation protein DedD
VPPQVRFYTLQVGAFGSAVNAIALAAELKTKFEGVFVDEAASGSTTPYRVRVGRLSRFTAAKELQMKLMEQGFDSFIVPPGTP